MLGLHDGFQHLLDFETQSREIAQAESWEVRRRAAFPVSKYCYQRHNVMAWLRF